MQGQPLTIKITELTVSIGIIAIFLLVFLSVNATIFDRFSPFLMSAPPNMLFPDGSYTEKDINMLSREDFFMIKQMRHQGASIVDIATQIGCSERTVRRYLRYPSPPARKARLRMEKLRPFMEYIDKLCCIK